MVSNIQEVILMCDIALIQGIISWSLNLSFKADFINSVLLATLTLISLSSPKLGMPANPGGGGALFFSVGLDFSWEPSQEQSDHFKTENKFISCASASRWTTLTFASELTLAHLSSDCYGPPKPTSNRVKGWNREAWLVRNLKWTNMIRDTRPELQRWHLQLIFWSIAHTLTDGAPNYSRLTPLEDK